MQNFFDKLDRLAGCETQIGIARWLERIAFIFLILSVLSVPHSIAATQISWLTGIVVWAIRMFVKPRPKLVRTPLDIALWSFFGWTIVSTIFSYASDISIGRLRSVALFLLFYFVVNNIRNVRAAKFLASALVFSCMANVLWLPIERIYGRGVKVSGVRPDSIFAKAVEFDHDVYLGAKGRDPRLFDRTAPAEGKSLPVESGDTVLRANLLSVRTPDELVAEIEKNDVTYIEDYHNPLYFSMKIRRGDLLPGATAVERLGVSSWTRDRTWRYAGFYGQIITYAEVLQMIMSLAFGLFIASLGRKKDDFEQSNVEPKRNKFYKFYLPSALLFFCLAWMSFALLMTATRAAQIAFLCSAATVVVASGNRKLLAALAVLILPVALGGYLFVQKTRTIDVDGQKDPSVNYRQTVYREGFHLWTSSPRNLLLGVGMDSVKRFKEEWHLFDNGRLEASHFHSTPLQLLVERGLPALLLWLWILGICAGTFWRGVKFRIQDSGFRIQDSGFRIQDSKFKIQDSEFELSNPKSKIQNPKSVDWLTRGIFLGCLGGLIGFFVSSLVNYSLGDSEVAMAFYLLMGIGISLSILLRKQ